MNKKLWGRILCLALVLILFGTGCTQPAPSTQNPTPSTPVTTEPTENQGGEEKVEIVYCAVGKVDETAKTAKVLLGTGEITTLTWTGDTAPTVGTVNVFVKEGDAYKIESPRVFPPNGASFQQWDATYASARQKRFWLNEMYFVTNETVFFVRYSDTEWRVFKGRDAMKNDNYTRGYMYFTKQVQETAKVLEYMMVVGQYEAAGKWPAATKETTAFLDPNGVGWDSGDKDLS